MRGGPLTSQRPVQVEAHTLPPHGRRPLETLTAILKGNMKRQQIIHQANAGLGAARNAGVARATGKYLTFVDSDDMVEPGAYARIVTILEQTGSDFAVSSYRLLRNGKLRPPAPWIIAAHSIERR